MATQTTNLNLIKPSGSDKIRIAQINQNMDILDEKIGPVGSSSLQAQMSTVTGYTTMSNGTNLNALTTKANYLVGNISQMLNAPTGAGTSGFFYVDNNSTYILQRFWGDQDKAYRFSYNSGSTWTSWVVHKTQIDSLNSQRGSKSSIASDTEILGYAPGTYMIALSAASDYLPERWGTLIVDKSGSTYGCATFVATSGTIYTRHMNGNNAWHGAWVKVAKESEVKLVRKIVTYTNLTLPSTDNPYVLLDDYAGIGVPTTYYMVSAIIRGWNNCHVGCMNIVKASAGGEWYLMGSQGGTVGSVTVEYFFVPSVDAL